MADQMHLYAALREALQWKQVPELYVVMETQDLIEWFEWFLQHKFSSPGAEKDRAFAQIIFAQIKSELLAVEAARKLIGLTNESA